MAADEHGNHQQQETVDRDSNYQIVSKIGRISASKTKEDQRATHRIHNGEQGGNYNGNGASELSDDVQLFSLS